MKINVPSIKVWTSVVIAFFLFQLVVIIYYHQPSNSKGDIWFSSQLNDIRSDFVDKNKSAFNVIVIGSSLVGNAVDCPDEIAAILKSYPATKISIRKIWQPHDPFEYLVTKKNLISELLLLKPDLVCIQTELAAIRYEEPDKYFYSGLENYLEDLAVKNTTIFEELFTKRKISFINCEDNFIDYEVVTDTLQYVPARRYVKTTAEIQFALEGLKKLTGAGIKTVLIDIPLPQLVEQLMYTKPFMEGLNLLLDEYGRNLGIEHWKYTGRPMYFTDFYDGGHLNREGRHLFSRNLVEKIIKETSNRR